MSNEGSGDEEEILAEIQAAETAPLPAAAEADEKPPGGWQKVWSTLALIPEKGDALLALLNGFMGDRMEREGSPLLISMSFFHDGEELDLDRPLSAQIPDATEKVAVFVHGLMCTETIWRFPNNRRASIGERLHEEEGVTEVVVRYNSGLHISSNGRQLAGMVQSLVSAWPLPVEDVSLFGYSMGGLVARSAAHYAEVDGHGWVGLLKRMFLIGVPLRGSNVEQLLHVASYTLKTVPNPVTWVISWVFRQRSAGIKDLRHGFIVDEEWQHRDPDAMSFGRRFKVPLTPGVSHFVIAGNLAGDEHHPLAKIVGDALVTPFSAKDEGFDGTPTERAARGARVFPGLGHLAIVNDEAVCSQILEWWRLGQQ